MLTVPQSSLAQAWTVFALAASYTLAHRITIERPFSRMNSLMVSLSYGQSLAGSRLTI